MSIQELGGLWEKGDRFIFPLFSAFPTLEILPVFPFLLMQQMGTMWLMGTMRLMGTDLKSVPISLGRAASPLSPLERFKAQ